MIKFSGKNKISCKNVSMRKVMVEYVWWTLAGKPNNHTIKDRNGNKTK